MMCVLLLTLLFDSTLDYFNLMRKRYLQSTDLISLAFLLAQYLFSTYCFSSYYVLFRYLIIVRTYKKKLPTTIVYKNFIGTKLVYLLLAIHVSISNCTIQIFLLTFLQAPQFVMGT